jgi:hypothetical protein
MKAEDIDQFIGDTGWPGSVLPIAIVHSSLTLKRFEGSAAVEVD